jgi:flagellar basal body rod protein FlgG
LDEYKLLCTDIENINTFGYKSYYSLELNRAASVINNTQGSLMHTDNYFNCAIVGEGFFKLKLDNGIGYTRNGEFRINGYGELLVSTSGLPFYDPVYLPEYNLPETLNITKNGEIYVSIVHKGEITETYIGKIERYNIPLELLVYYEHGIYKLNNDLYNEEIVAEDIIFHANIILNRFLESSNCDTLSIFLRMYYILLQLDSKLIANVEFKREIVKMLIERILNINTENYIRITNAVEKFAPFLRYDY